MLRYLAVLLLASLAQSTAAQENYPSRQITLIAPFAAGGSTDLVARVSRRSAGQAWPTGDRQNKPGGTRLIGAREVVKADPDGYTRWRCELHRLRWGGREDGTAGLPHG